MNKTHIFTFAILACAICFMPELGFASVESTLSAMQSRLIGTILPMVAVLGLVFAAMSFVLGSPNAKGHLMLAIIGAVVGFGAPSLINFIRQIVH